MDYYTIQIAYPWEINPHEITIKSETLEYTEMGSIHSGCQCKNMDKQKLIHDKCKEVADLIREIDKLNNE